MPIAILTLELGLPGCASLKEKRSRLKPLLSRLQREFNVASAEIDWQDAHEVALIAVVTVSADANQNHRLLMQVLDFVESHFPDAPVQAHGIELI